MYCNDETSSPIIHFFSLFSGVATDTTTKITSAQCLLFHKVVFPQGISKAFPDSKHRKVICSTSLISTAQQLCDVSSRSTASLIRTVWVVTSLPVLYLNMTDSQCAPSPSHHHFKDTSVIDNGIQLTTQPDSLNPGAVLSYL